MSSSIISLFNLIIKEITICIGIPIFIFGIIGSILNIIIFLSLKTFRESSCAFYLTIMSFMSIGQLSTGLLSRIMISGFNIDWTQTSIIYCKIRPFIIYITSLISASCLCLATIDQYFATCTRPRWQQWCNIKLARRLITIFSIIWIFEQIPSLLFYNHIIQSITNETICTITNNYFLQFNIYFTLYILWFTLPVFITVLFGLLAYHNVRQITYRTIPLVRRELDKQLTIMVLIQVFINFITTLADLIPNLLSLNQNLEKNSNSMAQLSFSMNLTIYLFYLNFSSPFYIYICVSERFRRQLIYVIFNIHSNQVQQQLKTINQIGPVV